jgi:hypothetical protein
MRKALERWWYPAFILVPAFVAVVYFSGVVEMAGWLRLLVIVLWLVLAAVAIRRYARRSIPA